MDIHNWAQEAYQLRLGSIVGNFVLSRAVNVMGLQPFYGKGAVTVGWFADRTWKNK